MTLPPATVLIVDDQPTTLEQWRSSFEEQGTKVIAVNSGRTALEVCENILPDLILSDLDMPKMDGFELLKRLKSNPVTENIPVCICSGTTDVASKYLCLTLGAIAYLQKPLVMSDLMAALDSEAKFLPVVA